MKDQIIPNHNPDLYLIEVDELSASIIECPETNWRLHWYLKPVIGFRVPDASKLEVPQPITLEGPMTINADCIYFNMANKHWWWTMVRQGKGEDDLRNCVIEHLENFKRLTEIRDSVISKGLC